MKKLIFKFLLLSPFFTSGQSPITHSAGYGDEIPSPACLACPGSDWMDLQNITSEDGKLTTVGLTANGNCFQSVCYYSKFLYARNFNFNIPAEAIIDSIFVDIKRASMDPNTVMDTIVQLEKNGLMAGNNLASPMIWPTTMTYQSYGHDDPLWGTTWTPAEINDTTTGVVLKIRNLSDSLAAAAVDHTRMTVYYSTTNGTYSLTSSPADIRLINSPGEIQLMVFTPVAMDAGVKIYNANGQEVYFMNFGKSSAGQNYFHCPVTELVSGLYYLVLDIGRQSYTRKVFVSN
jgi:hypothetical protein